ncbi:hypothetical protein Pcinc_023752 [Petrolisthes cinctipes]|uniref:Reverse transcriptase n=1 Tax=Petrolisthes cinctipes TaxID=88211 RepID=A0AAE1FCJ6_PETCI|nr:hypothetical protein Pcinc_023752 [Petrolisthes cinctipes]
MVEDRVSNIFKCQSLAQLSQFPFPQVTTEKVYKAAAEIAFIPATDSYTSSYTAAPSSYHLLYLPSVEDRGAETTELVKEDDLARNRALSQFSGLSLRFWLAKISYAPGTTSAAFVSTAALSFVDSYYSVYSSPLSFSTVCEVGSTINPPTLSGIYARRHRHGREPVSVDFGSTVSGCFGTSVRRQETGCCLDSFQHLQQPFSSESRITLGSRPSSQTIGQRFHRPERAGQSSKNLLLKAKYVVSKQDSDKLSLVVDLSRLNKFIKAQHFRMLHQELKMVIKTCKAMGFTFNLPKSQIVPTQQLPWLAMLGDTQIQTLLTHFEGGGSRCASGELELLVIHLLVSSTIFKDAAIRVFQTKEFQREDSAGCSLMEITTLVPTTPVMVFISSAPQSPGLVGGRN